MNVKELILKLQLKVHPEGGYYRETYRSAGTVTADSGMVRNTSTAIYYLLENEDKSHFHRIQSDELWFFHQGQPLEICVILGDQLFIIHLGNEIDKGEVPQAIIPANCWFASSVKNAVGYSLVSCTVSPGFDFSDFELAGRENMIQQYPHLKNIIEKYT
ncbi:MAG: cupin domain-containing protein [Bacteroidales bacterium]|nr:cupin domain-containing protein [Bacteroidales bacterium]